MRSEEAIRRLCKVITGNTPTVAEFNENYRRLMFRKQGMPHRVLNVPMPLPAWAIDAGTD